VAYVIAAVIVVALVALYAYRTARRLDRLHARVDAAAAGLTAQLLRRAAMAGSFGASVPLKPEPAAALTGAAMTAAQTPGLGHDREVAETAVTRALFRAAESTPESFTMPSVAATEMHDAALRASFARRFYNDTVRDALAVRDLRVVRWLRLAGHARHPAYFEMEDSELPTAQISVASGPTIEP
jgi:hypothetical protein